MNKKFLSAILFGALIASSTGTFTSCKDYDDDINGLNERVDKIQSTLDQLTKDFGSLAYVKSVSFANGKLTVVDQSGKATDYIIPDKDTDTNTTYTLDVTSKKEGNSTVVTVTLTPSVGAAIVKTFTIEGTKDTDTTLDPSLFWMDADGVMWYGENGNTAKSKKTGVTVPSHEKTGVTIVEHKVGGVVVGWELKVDDKTTKLLISDVLPITGFEYIPNKVMADFGRVILFEENSYIPKKIENNAVKDKGTRSLYMSNVAAPQYHVNPSSATIAQLAENGKATVLNKTLELVTRKPGTLIEWKSTEIKKGVMTVKLEADPALFEQDQNKLDAIALEFTTPAGNKVTTEYVGVLNKDKKLNVFLTDKDVTALDAKDDNCHFATTKAAAAAQSAHVNNENQADNPHHLVQCVEYSKAIAGINMKELVSACDVQGTTHNFFDYAKYEDLTLSFEEVEYVKVQTPQQEYCYLSGDNNQIFNAVNYGQENESCIGKSPIILAKLTDKHNKNAIVAAAYIKFLIVGDAPAQPEPNKEVVNSEVIGLGCNNPAYAWTTTDKFMSTEVYTFKAYEGVLKELSKKQFHALYPTFHTTAPTALGLVNKGDWTISESITSGVGEINHEVKFQLNDRPLEAGQYYAYAVYQKTTAPNIILTVEEGSKYPEFVIIKHVVTVDPVNFTATMGVKAEYAWEGNRASVYCETPTTNNCEIHGDLNELFQGGRVQFTYTENFDPAKFADFAANMGYQFIFDAKYLKTTWAKAPKAIGADGTEYALMTDAAQQKLYAYTRSEYTFASTIPANLIATLSGTENNIVKYQNNAKSQNLLNVAERGAKSFTVGMDVRYFNACDLEVEVTNGAFDLAFIRPVNVAKNAAAPHFTDGLNAQDPKNTLKLSDLLNFTDWRKESPLNSFAANLEYFRYYGVTRINVEGRLIDVIKTNWAGGKKSLKEAFGADLADDIVDIDVKNVNYTSLPSPLTQVPDFGTVSYIKTSRVEVKDYKLYIPVTVTYTWGKITTEIEVDVKATK